MAWIDYHYHVGDTPNQLVEGCLRDFVKHRSAALDLGAGNFRDSKFLLTQGFGRVVAVDSSDDSLPFWTPEIELHQEPIETFVPEEGVFDFAFCCNTLFFLTREEVVDVFRNVARGLRPEGVFACNVLGPEDDWVTEGRKVSSFAPDDLLALATQHFEVFGGHETKSFGPVLDKEGRPSQKLWHLISIAMHKP